MMRQLIYILLFAGLLSLAQPVSAAKFATDAFSLGVGGRGMALGGAVIAGPFDGSAPYWNPAGMNHVDGRLIMAMHAETFGSLLNHDYIGYVDARPRDGKLIRSWGVYLYYLGGGGVNITRLNNNSRPEIESQQSHGDFLLGASVATKPSGKLDIGLTGKIIYRNLATESGWGLSLDAGAIYQAHRNLDVGLMVTDITTGFVRYSGGSTIGSGDGSFETGSRTESLYPTIKPGLTFSKTHNEFTGRFLVSGDIRFEDFQTTAQYWSGSVSIDSHFGWELGYRELYFGRAGFDIGRFTAGAGLTVRKITVDFAYLNHSQLDETLRFSAGYSFR